MNRYEGIHCPVCGKPLEEEDLITVCPVCGTPHHAECYRAQGHCAHEDWHASGKRFSIEEERAANAPEADKSEEALCCPRCGTPCEKDSIYCKHCGQPLGQQNPGAFGPSPFDQGANRQPETQNPYDPQGNRQTGVFGMSGPFVIPPFAGMDPDEELAEGITVREYAAFIGPASTQYLLRFKRITEKGRTISWNILFGLGNAFYLLYRKIYKWGIPLMIYLGLFLGVYAATTILTLQNVLSQIGDASYTMDTLYTLMESAMYDLPVWLLNAFIGMRYTLFPIILALALFGDKIYFNHCTSRIHALKQAHDQSQDAPPLLEVLRSKGGANRKVMFITLLLAAAVFTIIPFLSTAMFMM